ncbi:MAG: CopD family protein [Chloroflexi bacterium]|nr:CopD family protein [Chloroflexota bacterium]
MLENTLWQGLLLCAYCALTGGFFIERTALAGEYARLVHERTQTARLRATSWALIAAFLTTALAFIAAQGVGGEIGTVIVWVRVGLLLVLLVLLRNRVRGPWAALLSLLLLGTQSALSRSAAMGIPALLGDWLHLTLAAFWLGGVVMLGVIAVALVREPDVVVMHSFGAAIERFSPLALFCVAGLALGGIAQSAQFLGSFEALWTSDYGRALSVKLVLFAVLIGFGAFHQLVLAPQLRRWALMKGAADDGAALVRRFRRGLVAEAVLGGVLLLAVAAMKVLPAVITP